MTDVIRSLAAHGERPALLTSERTITYAELASRVDEAAEILGPERRLVALAAANHPEAVILALGAIAGRHPLILVGADRPEALRAAVDRYDPDVITRPGDPSRAGGWTIEERRDRSRHVLHPDLALLLSTSGSTGSPKLVRLSEANVLANADSIATYLHIGPDDRAITSLPMAYCYGLSVITSHLVRGASVVMTERSVIDPGFWDLARDTRATSFAGVPYTFDLLDRVGFAGMSLPDLRYVTQAGGRLDPRRVREYAELGRRRGWELVVMYGQTEATARMTFLPPALAATRPESIGRPIPGGSIRLDPVPDAPDGSGELVYRGPNVMLGYAEDATDLARGRTIDELRTGDLARQGTDGMYEIVGRRHQFLKIAGLRIDPHGVERLVEREGPRACAVGSDDELVVFTEGGDVADLTTRIRGAIGLPAHALRVLALPELPRLPNGKPDRSAMRALAATLPPTPRDAADGGDDVRSALRALYAAALGRPVVADEDSFSSLGGDSLSYVEVTLGLEERLGRLPTGWATMTVRQLAALAAPATAAPTPAAPTPAAATPVPAMPRGALRAIRWRSIEMTVALRAVAIVLVVATHIGMVAAAGGAHVLMAVAGYNFARFRLTPVPRADRLRAQLRATARIAIPAMAWVGVAMLLLGEYELRHLLLVNALVRDELWGNLWFIELLVYIGLAMAALLAVPALDRAERRHPFAAAMVVLGIGLLFRYEVVDVGIPYTMPVLWLFAIGWAACRAERSWQRALVLGIAIASVPGYFDAWERNLTILVGLVLLVAIPRVRVPGLAARAAGVLAGASLYIYLVHWEVWPMFRDWYGVPSLLASLAAGIVLWQVAERIPAAIAGVRSWLSGHGALGGAFPRRATEGPWR